VSVLVRVLEVVLVAGIGLALLVPILRGAIGKARPVPGETPGTGAGGRSATQLDEARRRRAGWVGGTLFAIAVVNGVAFGVHTDSLGGSAYGGEPVVGWRSVSADGQEYTEGNGPAPDRSEGRYYVSSHGRYTQVTEQQWQAVRLHEFARYVTHALGLVVGGGLIAYSQRWWVSQKQAEPSAAADRGGIIRSRDS
jgi:hypothetical protein